MLEKIFLQHNLRVVNLGSVIESAEVPLIDELYKYDLLHSKKMSKDIQKLFFHFISTEILNHYVAPLEAVKGTPQSFSFEKCVMYFSPNDLQGIRQLFGYYGVGAAKEINRVIRHLQKTTPIRFFIDLLPFTVAMNHIDAKTGEGTDLVTKLKSLVEKDDNTSYTFADILKFTLQNELNALTTRLQSPARHKLLIA